MQEPLTIPFKVPYSGNLSAGENFHELLKVGFSRLKLSRIARNDCDTPIDNDTAVCANWPETAKFAQVLTRERFPLCGILWNQHLTPTDKHPILCMSIWSMMVFHCLVYYNRMKNSYGDKKILYSSRIHP